MTSFLPAIRLLLDAALPPKGYFFVRETLPWILVAVLIVAAVLLVYLLMRRRRRQAAAAARKPENSGRNQKNDTV